MTTVSLLSFSLSLSLSFSVFLSFFLSLPLSVSRGLSFSLSFFLDVIFRLALSELHSSSGRQNGVVVSAVAHVRLLRCPRPFEN